jgi:predicted ATP-grasp superfamily ATP-dependent carboligase
MDKERASEQIELLLEVEGKRLGQTDEREMLLEAMDEFKKLVDAGVVKPRGNNLLPMDKRFVETIAFNSPV